MISFTAGKRIQISNDAQVYPEVEIASQFHFRLATKRKNPPGITERVFSASVAVRGGFEPPVRLNTVRRFSKPVISATHPPNQIVQNNICFNIQNKTNNIH